MWKHQTCGLLAATLTDAMQNKCPSHSVNSINAASSACKKVWHMHDGMPDKSSCQRSQLARQIISLPDRPARQISLPDRLARQVSLPESERSACQTSQPARKVHPARQASLSEKGACQTRIRLYACGIIMGKSVHLESQDLESNIPTYLMSLGDHAHDMLLSILVLSANLNRRHDH
eukprot:12401052-Karenia_brevis.AAC.1